MSTTRMIARARKLVAVGVLATLVLAAVAVAGHWPTKGGDPGHSGHQPVDPTGPPVAMNYTAPETDIRTSIVASSGDQRLIYSTSDGRVHHRGLDDGQPAFATKVVLSPDFTADSDIFGSGIAEITPLDSSPEGDNGYTFQVFNDNAADTDPTGSDIALSIFRQSDGTLIDTARIAGGTNYTATSTPVLFQDAIWFIATPDGLPNPPPPDPMATTKLFKVNIGDPTGVGGNPTIGTVKTVNVSGVNSVTSPTALYLNNADGDPKPYVALSYSSGNSVRTFSADTVDPVAGPASGDLAGGAAYTVSVPALEGGGMPAPGEAVETAPYMYVAVATAEPISDYQGSQVHKLVQNPDSVNALILAPDESHSTAPVIGNPAVMLSVNQVADDPLSGGHVVLTTSCDVYTFPVNDMAHTEPLLLSAAPDNCANSGTTSLPEGFRRTTAALSGNLGFVQRTNGDQVVFTIDDADPLPADQFEEVDPQDATAAWGQPAISSRMIAFGDDKRLSVYSSEEPLAPGQTGAGFSVSDVSIAEGNSGERMATFTVSHAGNVSGSIRVNTADNSAKAGEDYTPITDQALTFSAEEKSKTVDVPIKGDGIIEADETFFVRLSRPRGPGASIVDGEGLGLITNDDGAGAGGLGITDVTATEGIPATFNITLSNPAAGVISVNYATADDTAKAGSDYTASSGKVTFNPGETTKTVAVPVLKDSRAENPERFFLKLSGAAGASITDDSGTALISDAVRRKPRRFTANVRPRRDAAKPFRFVTTGRLTLPTGMSRVAGCRGRVQVQVKAGRKTISARRTRVRSTCRYRGRVTFKNAKRFNRSGRLKFSVRFLGNAELTRSRTLKRFVRTK